ADSLARVLCVPAGGPMQPEWVVVHSRGMERWLSQQLAQRLGVCANVHFPFPAKVLHELTGPAAPSGGAVGEAWSPPRLVWSILRQLPGLLGEEAFAPLLGCLGAGEQAAAGPDAAGMGRPVDRRAYLLARRIADTFDRYVTFRPEMVLGWDAPSQEEQDWQPLLWRSLRRVIAAPHLADLLRGPGAALRLDGLPPRLCFFAISTLPPFFLELLGRLAREREVYLFVLCPAREYTGAIRSRKEIARELKGALREGVLPEQLHLEEGNPLLASFGRLVREFQIVLEGTEAGCPYDELPGDLFVEPISAGGPGSPTMLQLLQSDVLHLRQRGTGRSDDPERFPPPRPVAAGDRSISIHACHGPMRQVEVLRDELLGLLAADPTLQPRDIVVMAPDIEAYAPLLEAVLVDGDPPRRGGGAAGAGAGAGAAPEVAEGEGQPGRVGFPSLPFRIADRSLRQENVVAEALLALLELAGGRTPASAVLDLLALPPVRRRFAIAAEELPMIRQWVGESGIRWGIDREHRQEHGQPGYQENTWRFGLDRLLLGVAMAGEGRRFFGGVLPYDELEGQTTDLCGRFVEFGETLFAELQELAAPRPLAGWRERLGRLLQAMTAVEDDEVWLQQQLRDLLDEIVQYAGNSGFSGELDRDCLSLLLEQGTSGKGPASGFGSGAITCCAMVPLRSIPFRVVCLLGMDDGAFPRAATRLGFDRLAADPRLGDRDPREEDRYLFLEALLSARQQLIITYTGRSIRDNERLPPAVPVGELLDVLSASFFPEEGGAEQAAGEGAGRAADLRERLISEHPLQPFSPQSFCAGGPGPRSFDLRYLAAARRLC
ncbi:MAG: exonuclease V subunit gamma, partial [Deltaproteobacteria bacterium]|nr:exonuclease V subunit gamma [Deltaproteobacteria bacterium]